MAEQTFRFDSVGEILEALSKPPAHPHNDWFEKATPSELWKEDGICSDRKISTAKQARAALANPLFPQGVERIERLSRLIQPPEPVCVRRVPRRWSEGDELDIGRVWSGELDIAWRQMHRAAKVGPSRVLLAVDANIVYDASAERLAWRGVAALALAEALVSAGHVVKIVSGINATTSDRYSTKFTCEVTVVEAGWPLDIHRAASLLASGLLARGIIYDLQVRSCNTPVRRSIGSVVELESGSLSTAGFSDVFIASKSVFDETSAQSWIDSAVRAIDDRVSGTSGMKLPS